MLKTTNHFVKIKFMDDKDFLKLFTGEPKKPSSGYPYGYPSFLQQQEPEKKKHYIILLLGNGFDLQCGLKTTYKDFFDDSIREDEPENNTIYKSFRDTLNKNAKDSNFSLESIEAIYNANEDYSVWDIYFIYKKINKKTTKWVDIEKAMKKSIVNEKFWDPIADEFCNIINKTDTIENLRKFTNDLSNLITILMLDRYATREDGEFFIDEPDEDDYIEYFYECLVKELHKFEKRFGRYIKKQYEDNKEKYTDVARRNISKLYNDALIKSKFDRENSYLRIVSFNYIPLLDEEKNKDNRYVLNIHSNTNSPIFCFDGVNEETNDGLPKSRAGYYNLFSTEVREQNLNVHSYKFQTDYFMSLNIAYGLSFSKHDITDFSRILAPNYRPEKGNKFNKLFIYYPYKEDEDEEKNFLEEVTDNIRNLLSAIDKNLSFTKLEDKEIYRYEIKLDKIEDSEK